MTALVEPRLDGVLVRFGEIGIKSAPVRSAMLERLRANLLDRMLALKVEGDVERRGARLWMAGANLAGLVAAARLTFGVTSVSPCAVVPATLEAICAKAAEIAVGQPWTTFAVRARREGQHAFSSKDVQVQAGSAVYTAAQRAGRTPKVQLDQPDLEVHVDIRQDRAYIFTDEAPGPGGLPLGAQGKAVLLLSDEASCVAGWLLMRRGCRLVPVHAGDTGSLPVGAVEALHRWGMPNDVEVLPVCSGATTKATLLDAACRIAAEVRADAVATGDTLQSTLVTGRAKPILRPVCGLDARTYASVRDGIGLGHVDWPASVLAESSKETAESLLSMRRTVTA